MTTTRAADRLLHGRVPTHLHGIQIEVVGQGQLAGTFYDFFHPAPHLIDCVVGEVAGEDAMAMAASARVHLLRVVLPLQQLYLLRHPNGWKRETPEPEELVRQFEKLVAPQLLDLSMKLLYVRFDLQQRRCQYIDRGYGPPRLIGGQVGKEGAFHLPERAEVELGSLIRVSLTGEPWQERQTLQTATFGSELDQIDSVRTFLREVCSQSEPSWLEQLELAVAEAFANIVKHGYDSHPGHLIEIRAESNEDGIVIELSDQGSSFDPTATHLDLSGQMASGYGLYIISQAVDGAVYLPRRGEKGWNRLRLWKRHREEESNMNITQRVENSVLVIRLEGEALDAARAPDFKAHVLEALEQHQIYNVAFDLSELKFIDSSGLGAFLSILRQVNARDGDLRLSGMTEPVHTMFHIVRMHKLFDIYESVEECIHSFGTPQPHG